MKCKKCDNTNNNQDKYCSSCETQPQNNKAAKKIPKSIQIIIILLILITILSSPIYLLSNIGWHTIKLNTSYNKIDNPEIKELIKTEFNINDETHINKIKYQKGIDDGFIWKICIYYNTTKKICKDAQNGPFDYSI